jgi:hypothetical protein
MKNQPRLWLAAILSFILMIVPLALVISGNAATDLNGFDVDASGRVYVGRNYAIEVFDKGEKVAQIAVPHHRSWSFCLQENGEILLTDGSSAFRMNQSGEILSEAADHNTKLHGELVNRRKILGGDGQQYQMKDAWGWTRIVNAEGESLYRIPFVDVFAKASFGVATVFIFTVAVIASIRRKKKAEN